MPEVIARRAVSRPVSEIWAFVQNMDAWAPMLPGYAGHERSSDTDSVWTLEGDLGPFTRTVKLAVHITELAPATRIAFDVVGIGEDARGGGTFELSAIPADVAPLAAPVPWWRRLWLWLTGRPAVPTPAPGSTEVRFTFRIEAGGPMGPMINALLGPFAEEVARELVDRVGARLEGAPS